MEDSYLNDTILEIENEKDLLSKFENIKKLHKLIEKEENKLNKLSSKIDNNTKSKYDDLDLDQLIKKLENSENLDKKVKYYHSLCNKIDSIISEINY